MTPASDSSGNIHPLSLPPDLMTVQLLFTLPPVIHASAHVQNTQW